MTSRMDRYNDEVNRTSRSSRNRNLYNTMYSHGKYSNIEGVASLEKTNEIDINKVKEMLDSRERSQRERQYRRPSRELLNEDIPLSRTRFDDEQRSYDVNDVLKTAKENKEPDNKERVLNNTNYDILKKLNLQSKTSDTVSESDDIKELIETISNTSMLNKNDEDDINMFDDLVSDDTKVGEIKDIKEFTTKSDSMDDSFFTNSVKIKKADFVGVEKKKSPLKTIFAVIFALVLIGCFVILVLYYFGYVKF
ncbi:MAG: hypothetical protein IKF82_08560 [Bacilli bacterium]|nr:hypothetical protein [Bacilli bacterium]